MRLATGNSIQLNCCLSTSFLCAASPTRCSYHHQPDDPFPHPPLNPTVYSKADYVRRLLWRLHSSKALGFDCVSSRMLIACAASWLWGTSPCLQQSSEGPCAIKASHLIAVPKQCIPVASKLQISGIALTFEPRLLYWSTVLPTTWPPSVWKNLNRS